MTDTPARQRVRAEMRARDDAIKAQRAKLAAARKAGGRIWQRKRYQDLKARGRCVRCNDRFAVEGGTQCEECTRKRHEYYERRKAGL